MKKNKSNEKLFTAKDCNGEFPMFNSERERIRYMSNAYNKMSIAKAMSIFYGEPVSNEIKQNREINTVVTFELGEIYCGTVKEFNDRYMSFDIPGVKEDIICKEPLWNSYHNINDFLLNHDNKLLFEVRQKDNNKFIVSVINAYYRKWNEKIAKAANGDEGIMVHIDELVNGGYLCHTEILPLKQLTGQNYTASVFIPGSHIVLNIERDFERWVGQDVMIIPQKFIDYKVDKWNGTVEKSLVGSRKKVLQILGMRHMHDIWNLHKLGESNNMNFNRPSYPGIVTGIINSNKKTGVFVELEDKYITGLLPIDSSDLLNYKIGDPINVKINEFEIQDGKEPFEFKKYKSENKLVKCNVRPVFEIA